ncbi:MAG: hypothetical protein MSA89_06125 [Clostridium sp.]|nr:hypothetical protein [Clostridium sp.]MCI7442647.1 hypothetical protein [Clostridium sp.]
MECGDCFWYICGGIFDGCCEKHSRKKVDILQSACGDFLSEDYPSCSDCRHFQYTALNGKCTLKNKKIKCSVMAPPACGSFSE